MDLHASARGANLYDFGDIICKIVISFQYFLLEIAGPAFLVNSIS